LPPVPAQLVERLAEARGDDAPVLLHELPVVAVPREELLGPLDHRLVQAQGVSRVVHLVERVPLLPVLVPHPRLPLLLPELADVHLGVRVGVPEDVLDAPPGRAAVPPRPRAGRRRDAPQRRAHVVRVGEERVRRVALVVPVLLPLELAELLPLVHQRLGDDRAAARADRVPVPPVEDERRLVGVAAVPAALVLGLAALARETGRRGHRDLVGVVLEPRRGLRAVGAEAQDDRVVDPFADGGELVVGDLGAEEVGDPAGRGGEDVHLGAFRLFCDCEFPVSTRRGQISLSTKGVPRTPKVPITIP
ncbi:hypothetical protein THAOC_07734, partial [Thalassiosira oceanica]